MPEILPFRGVRYDTGRAAAADVLAPPYDVIDDAGRAALCAKHEHNCVRLILPVAPEKTEGADAKYATAAELFAAWQRDGVLVKDERPAIYRYNQIFQSAELGDRIVTRRGVIAAVRLHEFSEGVILPHERTLRGPKIDRLKLMTATGAHFSQIFGMYPDPSRETDRVFQSVERGEPDLDGVTDDGTRHQLWVVNDRELIGRFAKLMAPLKVYIADGHHRYETMLALRDQMGVSTPLSSHSSAQFATMFLANMDDDGLVVLPTHRLVHSLPDFSFEQFLAKAKEWFDIAYVAGAQLTAASVKSAIAAHAGGRAAFAVVVPGGEGAHVFALDAHTNPHTIIGGDATVAALDVSILHGLVLEQILGIDREAQEAQTNLAYIKDTQVALDRLGGGEGQLGFIMNATKLGQVKAVSDAGSVMPQKSTFFYPKIASGIVIRTVDPNEELS